MLFFRAPNEGSLEVWKDLFRREFSDNPAVKHYTFMWNSVTEGIGNIADFEKENFKVDFSAVLTATSVYRPLKHNPKVQVRPISTGAEWSAVTENQIISKAAEYGKESYRRFKEQHMSRYRTMSEKGLGYWFGAFIYGHLVGDLGVYSDGSLGRFQSVETHPDFQKQGVCGSFVYESAKFAFEKMKIKELVMVADAKYHAAKIYESVGFMPAAKEYSAFWWDKGS